MTTGDSANGRSMRALRRPRPGKRRRTMASAAMTPKTVLTGTAMAVIWSVSQKADWKAGRRDGLEHRLEAVLEGAQEDHRRRAAPAAAPRYSSTTQRTREACASRDGPPAMRPRAGGRGAAWARGRGHAASSWRDDAPAQEVEARSAARSEPTSSTTDTAAAAPRVVGLDLAVDVDRGDLGLDTGCCPR